MDLINVLVATHKKVNIESFGECYSLIQVGSALKEKLPYLHDDEEDNISYKNPTYCELTALYWGWKNIKAKYKGLCHYRRYLAKHYFAINSAKNVFTQEELLEILKNVDIILPQTKYRGIDNSWYPNEMLLEKDRSYSFIKKAMKKLYPEYMNSLKKVFLSKKMFFCNVMISKAEIYDEYCEWLFNLENEVESLLNKADGVKAREMGFYSEWLLNVWIEKNKNRFKIAYYPLARIDRKKDLKQLIFVILERTKLLYFFENIKYNMMYSKEEKKMEE